MRSRSSRASPNPVWLVSYWKMALWDRRTGKTPCAHEDRERSAAGSGKDFQQPTGSYRQARKDSVTDVRGSTVLLTARFWTSKLRSRKTTNFCCFRPPVCAALLQHPWETRTGHSAAKVRQKMENILKIKMPTVISQYSLVFCQSWLKVQCWPTCQFTTYTAGIEEKEEKLRQEGRSLFMWEHVHTTLVIPVAGKGEKIESQHENSSVLLPTSPPPLADMAQALFLRMFMRLEGGGGVESVLSVN